MVGLVSLGLRMYPTPLSSLEWDTQDVQLYIDLVYCKTAHVLSWECESSIPNPGPVNVQLNQRGSGGVFSLPRAIGLGL